MSIWNSKDRMKSIYWFAPLLAAIAACDGDDERRYNGTPYSYDIVECGQSHYTTLTEPGKEVIVNGHRFREVYGATDLNSQEDAPSVDFDTKQVIAIHAGTKGNPGHDLRVDQVTRVEDALVVYYTAIEPSTSGCSYPDVIVYPYCFISMDKASFPVRYDRRAEEGSC